MWYQVVGVWVVCISLFLLARAVYKRIGPSDSWNRYTVWGVRAAWVMGAVAFLDIPGRWKFAIPTGFFMAALIYAVSGYGWIRVAFIRDALPMDNELVKSRDDRVRPNDGTDVPGGGNGV